MQKLTPLVRVPDREVKPEVNSAILPVPASPPTVGVEEVDSRTPNMLSSIKACLDREAPLGLPKGITRADWLSNVSSVLMLPYKRLVDGLVTILKLFGVSLRVLAI